jgi:hypothetical protein
MYVDRELKYYLVKSVEPEDGRKLVETCSWLMYSLKMTGSRLKNVAG